MCSDSDCLSVWDHKVKHYTCTTYVIEVWDESECPHFASSMASLMLSAAHHWSCPCPTPPPLPSPPPPPPNLFPTNLGGNTNSYCRLARHPTWLGLGAYCLGEKPVPTWIASMSQLVECRTQGLVIRVSNPVRCTRKPCEFFQVKNVVVTRCLFAQPASIRIHAYVQCKL